MSDNSLKYEWKIDKLYFILIYALQNLFLKRNVSEIFIQPDFISENIYVSQTNILFENFYSIFQWSVERIESRQKSHHHLRSRSSIEGLPKDPNKVSP